MRNVLRGAMNTTNFRRSSDDPAISLPCPVLPPSRPPSYGNSLDDDFSPCPILPPSRPPSYGNSLDDDFSLNRSPTITRTPTSSRAQCCPRKLYNVVAPSVANQTTQSIPAGRGRTTLTKPCAIVSPYRYSNPEPPYYMNESDRRFKTLPYTDTREFTCDYQGVNSNNQSQNSNLRRSSFGSDNNSLVDTLNFNPIVSSTFNEDHCVYPANRNQMQPSRRLRLMVPYKPRMAAGLHYLPKIDESDELIWEELRKQAQKRKEEEERNVKCRVQIRNAKKVLATLDISAEKEKSLGVVNTQRKQSGAESLYIDHDEDERLDTLQKDNNKMLFSEQKIRFRNTINNRQSRRILSSLPVELANDAANEFINTAVSGIQNMIKSMKSKGELKSKLKDAKDDENSNKSGKDSISRKESNVSTLRKSMTNTLIDMVDIIAKRSTVQVPELKDMFQDLFELKKESNSEKSSEESVKKSRKKKNEALKVAPSKRQLIGLRGGMELQKKPEIDDCSSLCSSSLDEVFKTADLRRHISLSEVCSRLTIYQEIPR